MIKANFKTYNTYVTDSVYQWDINQVLSVSGLNLAVAPEVHFSNANMDKAIVRQSTLKDYVVSVNIPNSLLQDPYTIKAHIGIYEDDTFKVVEVIEIPVIAKARPADYKLENDEEIYSFEELKNHIANMVTLSAYNNNNANITARIDNIIAHNNDTEGNTELVDIRTDIDGNVHDSAGNAVREQIQKRKGYKTIGCVYPPRGANVDILKNDDGSVSVTVFADSLTYIEPGGTEYGGVAITYDKIVENIPNNCELTADNYLLFTIPNYNALCLDTSSGAVKIKSIRTLTGSDIVLIYNSWANVCGGTFLPFYYRHKRDEHNLVHESMIDFIGDQKTFVYIGTNALVNVEPDEVTGMTKITLGRGISYTIPTGDTSTTATGIPVEKIIEQLGSNKAVASGDGVIITLNSYQALCLNLTSETLIIRHLRNIKPDDIVLLYNSWANVQGLLLTKSLEHTVKELRENIEKVENDIDKLNSGDIFYTGDTLDKCEEYSALINDSKEVESFLFFTDPHLLQHGEDYEYFIKNYIVTLERYYKSTPTSFILCGGDWLGNSDTPTEAKYKLGYIDGFMHGIFDNYYSVLGNHDTNYQGVDDEGNTNAGLLDNQTIANLWYRPYGKNYYAFNGDNTRFYVLDSGTDWDYTLSEYRLAQIEWLGNMLKSEDKPHSAIAVHIYFSDTDGNKSVFAGEIGLLVTAYHKRESVTLNGVTYDFTACTGRVEFIITGHTHEDMIDYIDSSTPVISTLNTRNGNTPSFDLVYVDYDNRRVNLIRVGTGDNRTISLA